MPIPWLIGAAVVAVVAAVASSASEDAEKERQEEERRARRRAAEEEARIREEAEARREYAKREEARRQEEERIHALTQFSYAKAESLVDKYSIQGVSLDEVSDLAIYNPRKSVDVFHKSYLQSKKNLDMDDQKNLLEKQLREVDELSKLISNAG